MKALIVLAHPEVQSFNAALCDAAAKALRAIGVEVEISDLYRQGFSATASRADFLRPIHPERLSYAHEQRHASASRAYATEIVTEQDKVARSNLVVFQFPMWWYGPPAILKGWCDRVLSNGFAYGDDQQFENGLLRGRSAMLSVTTGGSEVELWHDAPVTGSVEDVLRPLTGGVIRFTGMRLLPTFISYAPARMSAEGRTAELGRLEEHLRGAVAELSQPEAAVRLRTRRTTSA